MTRDDYIKIVEQDYFGGVTAGDISAVLECFVDGAAILIRHGDAPERNFIVGGSGAAPDARDFYEHLCSSFIPRFDNFEHFVDLEARRAAATFVVTLTPRPDSPYLEHGVQTLHNCNFFEFEGRRISHMIIYYSNPSAGVQSASMPTGYPSTD